MAVSDELGLFAHPRPAIVSADAGAVVQAVLRLVEAEGITEIVVGLPLALSGGETDQTRTSRTFVARLRERSPVPVVEWDERLSSAQAERSVKGAARRKAGVVDSEAAAVVLQAALDSRRMAARR